MPNASKSNTAPQETNRERFRRLAEKRTSDVLAGIGKIGDLANRGRYEYGPEDVRTIREAVVGELDKACSALESGKQSNGPAFKLGD